MMFISALSTFRFVVCSAGTVLALGLAQSPSSFPLNSPAGLRPKNVTVESSTLEGKRGVRVATAPDALQRYATMTPEQRDAAIKAGAEEQLALIEGVTFSNGTIEADVAGTPNTAVFQDARGFVGIAFRVQDDLRTYDAFYLRPTNGRADDQLRRNHSTQYISHPAWTWNRLRTESPGLYESYVDLQPGAWTHIKIEVQGTKGKLYVHGQAQPTLVVNDLKSGAAAKGGVALWIDLGTQAHFRNLIVAARD